MNDTERTGHGYEVVAGELREKIEAGVYPPGSRLPNQQAIAAEYGVSLTTVRDATEELVLAGLVETRKRGGTVVRDPHRVVVALSRYGKVLSPGGTRGPWETACHDHGLEGEMRMVAVETVPAPTDIAHALDIEPGAPVIRRARHAFITTPAADGRPARTTCAQLQEAFYAAEKFAGTPIDGTEKIISGIYGAMAALGIRLGNPTERVTSRLATKEEAALLGMRSRRLPVLVVTRTTPDHEDAPLEVLRVITDPERVELVYDGLPLT